MNIDLGDGVFQYYEWSFPTTTKVPWINRTSVYTGHNQNTPKYVLQLEDILLRLQVPKVLDSGNSQLWQRLDT
jgi:hypothetical protein